MSLPPIELLNDTHSFPCIYIFKVIGKFEKDFSLRIRKAVQTELNEQKLPAHTERPSENAKHLAVTLEIKVQSAEQVHQIYHCLLKVEGILLIL